MASRLNSVSNTNSLFLEAVATNGYSESIQSAPFPRSLQRLFVERASSQNWYGVCSSADGTKLAAFVYNGGVYTSSDSGVSWTLQTNAGTSYWWFIVSSADGSRLAMIDDGTLWYSVNSGSTWTPNYSVSSSGGWYGLACSSNGNILYLADGNGYIYISTNGGSSFTQLTNSGIRRWYAVACSSDGTVVVGVVTNNYIYTSTDSGVNWTQRTSGLPTSVSWSSIACSSDGTKMVAGISGGGLYVSTNTGVSWNLVLSPSPGSGFNSVWMSSDGSTIVATSDYIYVTIDTGTTWIQQTSAGQKNWSSIRCSSDGFKTVASTFNGYIYTSALSLPSVTTITTSAVGSTAVRSGGLVRNDGGVEVTARGVCWNTTGTPTIADSKTVDGSGIGALTTTISGLVTGTTYYIRAYATNRVGTSYGQQVTFTTSTGGVIPLGSIVYTQSSVYSQNIAATNAGMTNGIFRETSQTGTNSGGTQWIQMDMLQNYKVSQVRVGCDFDNTLSGGWGKQWTENRDVEYSTDGISWTLAFNTGTFTQGIQTYNVNFTSRYIRIVSSTYIGLTEFNPVGSVI